MELKSALKILPVEAVQSTNLTGGSAGDRMAQYNDVDA